MKEDSHRGLLDREAVLKDAEQFRPQLELLEEMVNYGTNLIVRCYLGSEKKYRDLVVLTCLTRQIFTMLDGAHVLLKSGALYAANLQFRAILEASICLDFMLHDRTDEKSLYYVVANIRSEKHWTSKAISGTPENTNLSTMTKAAGFEVDSTFKSNQAGLKTQLTDIEDILKKPTFKAANEAYEAKSQKRGFDPPWYNFFGETSVKSMAKSMDRQVDYEFFYSTTSQIMHGSASRHHVQFDGSKVVINGLRGFEYINLMWDNLIRLVLHTILTVLGEYRPKELTNFRKMYMDEWRPIYLGMPIVQTESQIMEIDS